jgi:hypothetical protein
MHLGGTISHHCFFLFLITCRYSNIGDPGPSGRFNIYQTTIWIDHIIKKAIEYGSMLAIKVPIPMFLSYFLGENLIA